MAKYGTTWHAIKLKAHKLGLNRKSAHLVDLPVEAILADRESLSYKDILNKYGISQSTYYRLLEEHGQKSYVHYTDEDIQFIKDNYALMPEEEMEKKLQRSFGNAASMARSFGLKRDESVIPRRESNLPLTEEQICDKYNAGESSAQIADACGISSSHWIRDILKRNDVKCRELTDAFREYELDVDYFETVDTDEKAYFLGLMAADGCNIEEEYSVSIGLQAEDEYLLEYFRNAMKMAIPLRITQHENKKNMYNLRVSSKKMSSDLAHYGIVSRKSLILQWPEDLEDEFIPSFIRGFMDGDGCIYCNVELGQTRVDFVSTWEFLNDLRNNVYRLTGIENDNKMTHCTENNTYCFSYTGKENIIKFLDWIYAPGYPYLTRKYRKYMEIKNNFSKPDVAHPITPVVESPEGVSNRAIGGIISPRQAAADARTKAKGKAIDVPITDIRQAIANNTPPWFFCKRRDWLSFTPEKIEVMKRDIYDYYRLYGFPHIKYSDADHQEEITSLLKCNLDNQIVNGDIRINYNGMQYITEQFHHFFEYTKSGSKLTPMQVFNDDALFKDAIDLRVRYADRLAHMNMQLGLKLYPGVKAINNFRPIAAAAIYHRYCPDNAVVWDMSGGFGARLLGAFVSNKVVTYITTDPDTRTTGCLNAVGCRLIAQKRKLSSVVVNPIGSEVYKPEAGLFDVSFTSPPYFNAEIYANNATQSHVAFDNKNAWNNGFLKPTIESCFKGLKPGGKMIINVLNTQYHDTLEQDVKSHAEAAGFKHLETLRLLTTRSPRNKQGKLGAVKFEPVFVFGRPSC